MLVAHLADLHLGRSSLGDSQGAERLNSLRQAMATLARHQPDVFLIAGDTFDSPQTAPAVVAEAARIFCGARNASGEPIPVVVIPGNHDPADADKLWSAFEKSLAASPHVHIAREARVVELAGGKLLIEAYPCPTRYSAEPPWETRLPAATQGGAARVVLAHGTLQGGQVPEGETDAYPFTQAEVEALGADYVALGHFHGLYPAWDGEDECQKTCCYAGTHEPDQFGGEAGYALLATVNLAQPTRLQRIKVGRREWRRVVVSTPTDLDRVERLLEELRDDTPPRYVIRLDVRSRVGWAGDEAQRLYGLEKALLTLGAQVERRGDVRAVVEAESLDLAGLPSGAVKEALLSLQRDFEQCKAPAEREILAAALQIGWEKLQETIPA